MKWYELNSRNYIESGYFLICFSLLFSFFKYIILKKPLFLIKKSINPNKNNN